MPRAWRSTSTRGGSLLATFETSLYDETGAARKDFGLRDVFGVSFDGQVDRRMQNSLSRAGRGGAAGRTRSWPASRTRRASSIPCSACTCGRAAEFPSPVTLVPSYPDLPMEHVFPRVETTDERQVYLSESGQEPRRLLSR